VDSVLGLGGLGLMVSMGLALLQFQQASSCPALVRSRPCVASLQAAVSAPGRTQESVCSIVVTVRAALRPVSGWMFLPLVVVIVGISMLWTGFSAPAVYLCWW
jgi:hypothetical protein